MYKWADKKLPTYIGLLKVTATIRRKDWVEKVKRDGVICGEKVLRKIDWKLEIKKTKA